jgi:hypothetical protein
VANTGWFPKQYPTNPSNHFRLLPAWMRAMDETAVGPTQVRNKPPMEYVCVLQGEQKKRF